MILPQKKLLCYLLYDTIEARKMCKTLLVTLFKICFLQTLYKFAVTTKRATEEFIKFPRPCYISITNVSVKIEE